MSRPHHARLTDENLVAHIKANNGNPGQLTSGTAFVETDSGREHYRREPDGFWYLRSKRRIQ